MLLEEQRQKVAKILNPLINIPWLPEKWEYNVFFHAVGMIDDAIDELLPIGVKELILSSAAGVEGEGVKNLRERLITTLNKKIDIPYLDEADEELIIRMIVGMMIKAMSNGVNIADVIDGVE